MHAVPKAPGAQSVGTRKKELRSRLKKLLDEGKHPNLPEVRLPYLVEYLFEVGPTVPGAMGDVGLSHAEIRQWRLDMGLELRPWEIRALRHLSRVYAAEASRADSADCPAPFGVRVSREEIAAKIDQALGI